MSQLGFAMVDPGFGLTIHRFSMHILGNYEHSISVEPMPTPRPRSKVMTARSTGKKFVHVYHPSEYTKYKEEISWKLKDANCKLKPGDYTELYATFYMPYPASTPASKRIEGAKHMKKPDWDNFIKGFQDAMSDAGMLLKGDGNISDGNIRKRMTTQPNGYISFNIY